MKNEEIKKGIIVVIGAKSTTMGNLPGVPTKVLGKPGELADEFVKITGYKINPIHKRFILCEAVQPTCGSVHCNNKPAYQENISELTKANENQKKVYHNLKSK